MVRPFVLFVAPLLALSASMQPAFAQKTLRWKFTAGEKLHVAVEQQTVSTVTISSKAVKTTLGITLDTTWTVESADEQQAKIAQKVDRAQIKLQSGDASPIAFDSAEKSQPVGPAKDLATAVKPLLEEGAAIIVTMNTRGEVLSAEPSEKLAALWKVVGDTKEGAAAPRTKDATLELLKRSLVLLPEKPVKAGDKATWTSDREVELPIGKVKQQTTYTYAGEAEEEGKKLDKVDFNSKLDIALAAAKPKLTIKTQEQKGTVLFSADEGRVTIAEQTQRLVTEAPYRDTNITVSVESTVKTKISQVK